MSFDFLLEAFDRYGAKPALIWHDRAFTFEWIAAEVRRLASVLAARDDVAPGTVVALRADYSPRGLALLLALLDRRCITALLTDAFARQEAELFRIAQVATRIAVDDSDEVAFESLGHRAEHPLLLELVRSGSAGLILFSSGSTGKMKAVVHDAARLLDKYRTPRRAFKTIPFMLFDHIGGVHSAITTLSAGATLVIAGDRTPQTICRLIQTHRVQLLPTTPTFVNLLLLSDFRAFDLSSLEYLTYSAERMPQVSLSRLAAALPKVKLVQNYGLSEIGIIHSKSESSDSLFVKIFGDGYQTRVRDGLLEIKAQSSMLGYLNEASPFTDDGWFKTGDRVEQKGEYLKILGRQSDIIIIGGEKVYPAEVEDLIVSMVGVIDVIVSGEPNALTGHIVKAHVQLAGDESRADFRKRMHHFLAPKLQGFKIPQKVVVTREPLHNARFKKARFPS
jgi:long-chain acyl-CoA synthetase